MKFKKRNKMKNKNIWLGVPFTYNFIRRVRRVIYEKGNWLLFLKKEARIKKTRGHVSK